MATESQHAPRTTRPRSGHAGGALEPAPLRLQRAAGGPDADRLQHRRARIAGPRLRRLRHAGADDRAVADGHAGAHQPDGDRRASPPRRLPAADLAARRRADHQRPLDDLRPAQRLHRPHPHLPRWPAGRLLRQPLPCGRHRRPGLFRRGARDLRRGLARSRHQALRPRRAERGAVENHPRQRAPAGRDGGRPLRAGGLQRRGGPGAAADDGRVRPGEHRSPGRRDSVTLRAGPTRGHPRPARRRLPQRGLERRLRGADQASPSP